MIAHGLDRPALRADLLLLQEAREPAGRKVVYRAAEIYPGQG